MIEGLYFIAAKIRTQLQTKYIIIAAIALLVVGAGAISSVAYAASKYEAQINALKSKNATSKSKQQDLRASAGTISDTIASLRAEISALASQIQESKVKDAKLQEEIVQAEADLAYQKKVLGENIKQMYVKDEMSTLEMLATSKDLGDYVDKEQYRNSVQDKINNTMATINQLKEKLDKQRKEVQRLLKDQEAMQARVTEQKAENDRLLALNEQEQGQLESDMRSRNAEITALQKKQAEENARHNVSKVITGGSGGYPWANVPYPSSSPDPWGMYKRECVSYAAWRVANSGRYMPYWGGRGNAKLWDDNARAAGIPVSTNPRVGDVAVSNAGRYGHVMYVEAVHGDGTITVSQYNASWDGRYSEVRRSVTGLVFIHF